MKIVVSIRLHGVCGPPLMSWAVMVILLLPPTMVEVLPKTLSFLLQQALVLTVLIIS